MQVNSAIVHHIGGAMAGTASDFAMYHSARNQFLTIIKNIPGWLLCVVAPLYIASSVLLFLFGPSQTTPAIKKGVIAGFADSRTRGSSGE